MVSSIRPRTAIILALTGLFAASLASTPPPRPSLQRQQQHTHPPLTSLLAGKKKAVSAGCTMQDLVLQIGNNVAGAGILTGSAGMAAGGGGEPHAPSALRHHLPPNRRRVRDDGRDDIHRVMGRDVRRGLRVARRPLYCAHVPLRGHHLRGNLRRHRDAAFKPGGPTCAAQRASNQHRPALDLRAHAVIAPRRSLRVIFTSLLGVVAVLYTALFIAYRALDGAYALPAIVANGAASSSSGGQFIHSLPKALIPSFSKASRWKMDAKSLILVSNLGLAYIAHYNAPTFYRSLDRPSTKRFGKVCAMAFGVLSLLYLAIMLLGHRTFGDVTAANILRNYAERDPLAVLGRAATFASILFGFPLAMLGLKDSLFSLLTLPDTLMKPATLLLLACVATVAILVTDIGLVVGISGALLGAAIVYIFPALIYGSALRQHEAKLAKKKRKKREEEEKDACGWRHPDGSYG